MSYQQNRGFLGSLPPVTKNILIINAIIWFACFVFSRTQVDLADILSLHTIQSGRFRIYQLVTYMFLHVEFTHMFFNMFAVFMFGAVLEQTWGSKRFFNYYMITGIGAGLAQLFVCYLRINALESSIPADQMIDIHNQSQSMIELYRNYYTLVNSMSLGASGAVFGVLLAFGVLFPNTPLYIFFIPIPVKAKYFVILYGLVELYLGIANHSGDNVAHFAHLGGMLFGGILLLFWKKKYKRYDV